MNKRVFLLVTYYVAILYFSYLMLLITAQYLPISLDAAFLRIKPDEVQLVYYPYAFFVHVFTSICVLLTGIAQFSTFIRLRFTRWHRSLGKFYVFLVLLFASPSGLVLAYHANGGLSSQIAFTVMSVLWFYFTLKAYTAAIKKEWKKHEQFMLRSFAFTLSAISLRLFKWILAHTLALPPMEMYRIIAWAGFGVNWAVVEFFIYYKFKRGKRV